MTQSSELIINATPTGDRIALLRDKQLVEYHVESNNEEFHVGDIFFGIVHRIHANLNAAFIDIGYEKDAFLHYHDLGPNIKSQIKFTRLMQQGKKNSGVSPRLAGFKLEPEIDKFGKMSDVLKGNNLVLVQIAKEPIGSKGHRLSCEISLAGRYLVLVPFGDGVNVSKKITDNGERKRLLRLVSSIKPENFGVIVRTVAEGKDVAELDKDLNELLDKWQAGMEKLQTARPREKIIGEMSRATSILRDMLNESFDSIIVDTKEMYDEVRSFIQNIAPDKEKIVKLHSGKTKIFEQFGIEKQLKMLFGQTVSLPNGGYIVIEHTEALHVIDVNSGNKATNGEDQETTAFNVNMEAATEIARQLLLRDMGGIIVIDFIDMKNPQHKQQIYDHMRKEMKADRSKSTVLPLTKFGLMQITRQRVRPELNIVTHEKCPTCNGTGKITAAISVSDQIEAKLDYVLTKQNESGLTLTVHPYLHGYFSTGSIFSRRWKWFWKYYKWVKLEPDSSLAITEYYFKNKQGDVIELE